VLGGCGASLAPGIRTGAKNAKKVRNGICMGLESFCLDVVSDFRFGLGKFPTGLKIRESRTWRPCEAQETVLLPDLGKFFRVFIKGGALI
jgi:hypothetical protein